ncbi:MAG: DNA-formamidopyrimidine glycosylase family protein [Kosmotogaceae bacterium]
MPELPDVEVIKKNCEKHILNKRIVKVYKRDPKTVKPDEGLLNKTLVGKTFTKIFRHGKHMFIRSGNSTYILMHFGMTGDVAFYSKDSEEPEYTGLRFDFEDESSFSYICVRKLGKLDLIDKIEDYISGQSLGKDALKYSEREFVDYLKNKRGSIKSALMDQKSIAGIGNIYSDEIMYHANIYPGRKVIDMSEKEMKRIYLIMKKVLQNAIDNEAEPERMPKNYLVKRRKEGENCGICNGKIEKKKISGRSSYFCPEHQK